MRQQVQITVKITYDCDAQLSRDELAQQFHDDLCRLQDADSESRVEACKISILQIREEAQLYGTDEGEFRCTACQREESECSAEPCPAVIADREA